MNLEQGISDISPLLLPPHTHTLALNVCAHFALARVCVLCVRVSDSVRDKSLFNFAKKRVEKLSTFVAIYFKKAKTKFPYPPYPTFPSAPGSYFVHCEKF